MKKAYLFAFNVAVAAMWLWVSVLCAQKLEKID